MKKTNLTKDIFMGHRSSNQVFIKDVFCKNDIRHDFANFINDWCYNNNLQKYLPEIAKLDEFIHNEKWHPEGNPLDHTIECIRVADKMNYKPLVKLAVLFHDIGKGICAVKYNKDTHPYHNFISHEFEGLHLIENVAKRIEIPYKELDIIKFCIKNHMKVHLFNKMKKHKIEKIVLDSRWPILKNICYCDDASRYGVATEHYWNCINTAENMIFDDFSIYEV